MDKSKTIGEIYGVIHQLQLRIMHEYGVTMVFGMYAVDQESDASREMRRKIADFVRAHEHIISYHALYLTEDKSRLYYDLVVDYELKDWDGLDREFTEYMSSLYPQSQLELTIETEYV